MASFGAALRFCALLPVIHDMMPDILAEGGFEGSTISVRG